MFSLFEIVDKIKNTKRSEKCMKKEDINSYICLKSYSNRLKGNIILFFFEE